MLDLLLLGPAALVIGAAAVVVRRERRPEPGRAADPGEDVIVDLSFLRAAPREVDLRVAQLRAGTTGSLGSRLRQVQLADDASRRPTVRSRRRERPLVAAR